MTAAGWGEAWRRLPDDGLHALLELTELTDDDEHEVLVRDELEARARYRAEAQAAYDDANPELPEPWWVRP